MAVKCNLCQPDIINACAFKKNGDSKFSKPMWKDENNLGKKYSPSTNIAPTDITPVLISTTDENCDQIVKPMMWGMIPPWHHGSYKNHGLSTNNCRFETILSSKLYGASLRDGYRCVVLAEGFYEWQTANKSKQPYYIFSPQNDSTKMYPNSTDSVYDDINGWNGVKLLKMAGLYNIWKCEEGTLYSYSIITMESNKAMDWIHHRMPAFLETDKQVSDWLDVDNISYRDAIKILSPVSTLSSYPVSTLVNNSRNKSHDCNKPIQEGEIIVKSNAKEKSYGSKNIMSMWLKRESPGDKNEITKKKKI